MDGRLADILLRSNRSLSADYFFCRGSLSPTLFLFLFPTALFYYVLLLDALSPHARQRGQEEREKEKILESIVATSEGWHADVWRADLQIMCVCRVKKDRLDKQEKTGRTTTSPRRRGEGRQTFVIFGAC